MKNPLHYQLSDYDCGPTSVLNAVAYLFEREDIPPEILRNVMLYCLDCHSFDGAPGKLGTSTSAMMLSIRLQMKHRRNVHLYGAMWKGKSISFHLQI